MKVPENLSVSEVAQELNVSIFTIRSWLRQNRLQYLKLGKRVLIRREDLDRFVEKALVPARAED